MKKPQPKHEVAVVSYHKNHRLIVFQASPDAVEDFRDFGNIYPEQHNYHLIVFGRYDFDEVLAYIQNYGRED